MMLFCKTVAERTNPGQRLDIEEKSYTFHAYGRTEGVAGIIISDGDYPALVAHQLLSKVVDEFLAKYPRTSFSDPSTRENSCPLPQLKEYIVKFQDPGQADNIMKIQQELDETKIVLHKTIEGYVTIVVFQRQGLLTYSNRPRSKTHAAPSCEYFMSSFNPCRFRSLMISTWR